MIREYPFLRPIMRPNIHIYSGSFCQTVYDRDNFSRWFNFQRPLDYQNLQDWNRLFINYVPCTWSSLFYFHTHSNLQEELPLFYINEHYHHCHISRLILVLIKDGVYSSICLTRYRSSDLCLPDHYLAIFIKWYFIKTIPTSFAILWGDDPIKLAKNEKHLRF